MMEKIPSDTKLAAAETAAAPDPLLPALPHLPALPATASSDTVLTGDGTVRSNSSKSNVLSEPAMMAAKKKFYELLEVGLSEKKRRTEMVTEQEYDDICTVLQGWVVGVRHSPLHTKWNQNYTLSDNTTRSTALRWTKNNKNLRVATKEQIFAIIMNTHIESGHGIDSRRIHQLISKTWYGITREDVELAVGLCPICIASQTRKITAKQKPLKMILSVTVGKRAQMDLIDMTSQQDPGGYCWILRLVDHHSGFGATKPLKSKTSKECAIAIIEILSFFPDFDILQSDNGGEFLGETVKYVNE